MTLTGKIHYRAAWRPFRQPVLVLQVQESYLRTSMVGRRVETKTATRWRDAALADLATSVLAAANDDG